MTGSDVSTLMDTTIGSAGSTATNRSTINDPRDPGGPWVREAAGSSSWRLHFFRPSVRGRSGRTRTTSGPDFQWWRIRAILDIAVTLFLPWNRYCGRCLGPDPLRQGTVSLRAPLHSGVLHS